MTTPRRMGAPDSKTRGALLDVTARIMLEEGYAAATSRRVAAKAGVKPALVHYYFRTMDDLFLALFRKGAEAGLKRYEEALASDQPLRALWELSSEPNGTALLSEFQALANHRKAIRAEIADYGERFRAMQIKALTDILGDAGVNLDGVPAAALAFIITAVAQLLITEDVLGITAGHAETLALVERLLHRFADGSVPTS
ncbi:TetR/AcrR family transcriptional regulator [Frankia sp. CNm7]|uniref:TetR/AcrR family transcriptional regulator n=1 Tax=Frankia nepalensis TaxID=1836974 RepID=A0A937RCD9_9ACTN|nr:TetR/AcrR family transcriptional regulator [Frankia nepalensis]MBL7494952.1 TetR/AcrR family transcriptional regulator [Frankia nepalensis]MBL7513654.1 TetR/AcrR family transcriptional regulator [Frankia nepalensis]MBL7524289.1 TetR/AcrR family transcriptional regulator [Frankia nepalensis]MBL7627267.1 TetR/AcrR family transcriptional regulator [Frankia nepalensis]